MSIPFSDLLLQSVSSNMVLEADNHFLLSVLGAILVVIVILLFCRLFLSIVSADDSFIHSVLYLGFIVPLV